LNIIFEQIKEHLVTVIEIVLISVLFRRLKRLGTSEVGA
jgi:hypothetical protein